MLGYHARTQLNRVLWFVAVFGLILMMMTNDVFLALCVGIVVAVTIPFLLASVILHNVQRRKSALRVSEHHDLASNDWRDDWF